jgi:hypothetical protein
MEKFVLPTVLMLSMFQLVPPIFAEGGPLDVVAVDDYGKTIHGVYFDNVYNTILYIFLSWLSISIPVLFKNLGKPFEWLSLMTGAWWLAGSAFEIANFAEPLKVYNTPKVTHTYGYYLFIFIIGTTLIILNKKWSKLGQ